MLRRIAPKTPIALAIGFGLALSPPLSAQERPAPSAQGLAAEKGSGPYPAMMEVDPSLARHVVYRPHDLSAFGGARKLGIYVWGNGACSDDGASVPNHLLEIASYGYLVIASGYTGEELKRVQAARGEPQEGAPPVMPTSAQDMRDGLDWALAENGRAGSPYRGKLDPEMTAASGFSCGGVQALELATSDERINALIVHNSGLFPEDAERMAGMDLPKSALARLRMPVLYVQGGESDIAWNNGYDDFTRIDHVPAALVGLPVGHGGTYFEPHGGAAAMIATDWLEWQLRGDKAAARTFIGANCRLCTVPGWTIERKKLPDPKP